MAIYHRIAHAACGAITGVLAFLYLLPWAWLLWLSFIIYEIIEAWYFLQTKQRPDKVYRDLQDFFFPMFLIGVIVIILRLLGYM